MSWNRGDSKNQRGGRAAATRKSRVTLVLLAPLVLILSGIATWRTMHWGGDAVQKPKAPQGGRTIAEVKPATVAPVAMNAVSEASRSESKSQSPVATDPEKPADSLVLEPPKVIVNDGSRRPPDRYAVLALNCDKQIAGLLYAVPGQLMIGTVNFDEDFERQFKESLKTKLKPSQDATDEECEMIEAVNYAKEAIVAAMKKEGKTAGEILSEARQQMREFGRYKQMLKEELRRYEDNKEKTDADVSDLFDAANKMLKENGIEPFSPNDLTREVVRQYKFDQQEGEEQ